MITRTIFRVLWAATVFVFAFAVALGVLFLLGALFVVVAGTLVGTALSTFGVDWAKGSIFFDQQWEYLDLPRFWQILLVIGLFLAIAFATLRIARQTKDPFVRYCSFGIVIWLLGQMMINVGMVLALLPVIGIPVASGSLSGFDALLSTVQMPSGVPVATVAVNGAANAGVLAAQILALSDPELADRLEG